MGGENTMRVKINGKEVDIGPSSRVREKLEDDKDYLERRAEKQNAELPKLTILGREIDMDNPDDVQWAIRPCRLVGAVVFIILSVLFIVFYKNAENFLDFLMNGGFSIVVFALISSVFYFVVPKQLQKRLQKLRKQGKIPSKYNY